MTDKINIGTHGTRQYRIKKQTEIDIDIYVCHFCNAESETEFNIIQKHIFTPDNTECGFFSFYICPHCSNKAYILLENNVTINKGNVNGKNET